MAQRFSPQGYKDCWAASVFLLQLLATIILICALKFPEISTDQGSGSNSNDSAHIIKPHHADRASESTQTIGMSNLGAEIVEKIVGILVGVFLGMAAFAAIVGFAIVFFARRFPTQLIWASNVFFTLLCTVSALGNFVSGLPAVGCVWSLFALISIYWLYIVRKRIPFAASMLRTASGIVLKFRGTWVVSMCFVVLTIVYAFAWCVMVAKVSHCINFPLGVLLILCYYWSAQVITNVVHTTTCGTAASWYFGNNNTVPNPTVGSFKRAMTTSFGSICFGSLIVAALKTLRVVIRSVARRNALLMCIMSCILALIERWAQYFNEYAFVYVSVYGHSFTTSAKATFNLIKDCGITGIVNDCLVSKVFLLMTFIAAILTGCLGAAIGYSLNIPTVSLDDTQKTTFHVYVAIFFAFFGVLIACVVVPMLTSLINSCVVTLFVCYAEEPEALQAMNPDLHAELLRKIAIARGDEGATVPAGGDLDGSDDGDDGECPPLNAQNAYHSFHPQGEVGDDYDSQPNPKGTGYDPLANPWPATPDE